MKNIVSILVLASLLFTSCKKEETTESAPPEEVVTDGTAVTNDSLTAEATAATPEQVQPVANGATNTNSVMTQTTTSAKSYTTTAAPAAKGMNPAHGQPGHRCDISVGAPLNSPAGKTPAPTPTTQISSQSTTVTPAMLNQNGTLSPTTTTTTTPAASTTPVVTAPGMNPPHGQEGHVCSVAVGAPLPKN
ncbi:MAG: hypothetical protein V4648_00940 [Bacteroidota bacterium]